MVPNKWCIERTPQNAAEINGYFNRLHGKPKGYEKISGWMTNDTKSGVTGPFNKKPDGYSTITYQQFLAEFGSANIATAQPQAVAQGQLPNNWYVKGDGSAIMRECAKLIEEKFKVKWTGTSMGYYACLNGNFVARYVLTNPPGDCITLTPSELKAALLGIPSTSIHGANAISVANIPIMPAPQQNQMIINYKVIKTYPGSKPLNTLLQTNVLVKFDQDIVNSNEYYTPVYGQLAPIGAIVIGLIAGLNVSSGMLYEVIDDYNNAEYGQRLFTLRRKDGITSQNVPACMFRIALQHEAQAFYAVLVNGNVAVNNINTKQVVVNNVPMSYSFIKVMNNVKNENPTAVITIPGIGMINDSAIEALNKLVE